MNPPAHVSRVLDRVRDGLHAFTADLLREADLPLRVEGSVPTSGGPALVLLPYQVVLESQPSQPRTTLVPHSGEIRNDGVSQVWRLIGGAMTTIIVDHFPRRGPTGRAEGQVDPAPRLSQLPAPVAAWYREHAEAWVSEGEEPRGRLPSITWRQSFAFAVRYAAMVVDPEQQAPRIDALQLQGLGLVGFGVRQQRFLRVEVPESAITDELASLVAAFSKVDVPAAADLPEALEIALGERELAVGLTPHHELTDADLAHMTQSLGIPMQPALVFSVRLSLGGGPELGFGAQPHLASVEKGAER